MGCCGFCEELKVTGQLIEAYLIIPQKLVMINDQFEMFTHPKLKMSRSFLASHRKAKTSELKMPETL